MTDIKRVGDSGIHTVEGNIAGSRAARLTKQRDKEKAEYESVKNKIKEQNAAGVGRIDEKFSAGSDAVEQEFRKRTVGLVSSDDFRKAMNYVEEQKTNVLNNNSNNKSAEQIAKEALEKKLANRELKRKKMSAVLSFNIDEDVEGEGFDKQESQQGVDIKDMSEKDQAYINSNKKKVAKDPTTDTKFLPDRERDRRIAEEKERLQQEWLARQEVIKNEMLQVVYSYWDGSGHRMAIEVKKGTTVGRFLELVKMQVSADFSDIKLVSSEHLLYVKEDLIIPHHITFYDLIVTKARGKSGPLFHFDVHEDVRLVNDARLEKEESHPGKVVERRWYERNKHIFPASRWETYDPLIQRDRYTIHGDEVNGSNKK